MGLGWPGWRVWRRPAPSPGPGGQRSDCEDAIAVAVPPGDLGIALVGRPDDGWQRGTVARLCPRSVFSWPTTRA